MLYLVKMQRSFGDHQYIHCVCKDEDIAHFMGEYHQKFERGGHKYHYVIEPINWVYEKCFIVSWQNPDETLRYRVYLDEKFAEIPEGSDENYRFSAKTWESADESIDDDDLLHASEYWHFFKGKELLGLSKLYEVYRKKQVEIYLSELK